MNLSQVVQALERRGELVEAPRVSPDLTGVTEDSRRVGPGMLFCAVKGSAADGHRFIPDAIKRGAGALLVSERQAVPAGGSVPAVVVIAPPPRIGADHPTACAPKASANVQKSASGS